MTALLAPPSTVQVVDVQVREDLYPRLQRNPALVQRYAQNLDELPPIEVNQHNILIDGWHRLTAHRSAGVETIRVTVTETASELELFALAIRRNAAHGWQLEERDKKSAAIRLYAAGTGMNHAEIAAALSVSRRSVQSYLTDVDRQLREERKQRIFDLWLACHTTEEICERVQVGNATVSRETEVCSDVEALPIRNKVLATFSDSDWTPPLYNVWSYGKSSNSVEHFGKSEQRILENLLYLYTEPFDIVVDPFAGGGSTIDVCKRRSRRYWASDRKPIVERESEIRRLDVAAELPPLNKRWSDVRLTYLDPPYWRQAAGRYSDDAADLANMELGQFTETLAGIVKGIGRKQSAGVIALLIQPTQWHAPEHRYTDHVTDLIKAVGNDRVRVEYRISCPYPTEQYQPQLVTWAKENKQLLVLTRELIVWRVNG